MGVRGGDSYVSGLRAHPKNVWIAGRKVTDVTQDPALRRPVAAMAALYDCQVDDGLRAKRPIARMMPMTKRGFPSSCRAPLTIWSAVAKPCACGRMRRSGSWAARRII